MMTLYDTTFKVFISGHNLGHALSERCHDCHLFFPSASSSTFIKEGYEVEMPSVSSVDIVVFPEPTV